MLKHKAHVSIEQLNVHTALVCGVALGWMDKHGMACVVTSLDDSVHSDKSKHYPRNNPSNQCEAVDLRTKHLPSVLRDLFHHAMSASLEPLGYDVVLEYPGEDDEHLHVEYDPKRNEPFSEVSA